MKALALLESILISQRDLQDLYQALVQGGALDEHEFWHTRQDLLQAPSLAPKATQQLGLSSLFTPEMTLGGDGGSQKVPTRMEFAFSPADDLLCAHYLIIQFLFLSYLAAGINDACLLNHTGCSTNQAQTYVYELRSALIREWANFSILFDGADHGAINT